MMTDPARLLIRRVSALAVALVLALGLVHTLRANAAGIVIVTGFPGRVAGTLFRPGATVSQTPAPVSVAFVIRGPDGKTYMERVDYYKPYCLQGETADGQRCLDFDSRILPEGDNTLTVYVREQEGTAQPTVRSLKGRVVNDTKGAAQADFFVDGTYTGANGASDGSRTRPWTTLNAAINSVAVEGATGERDRKTILVRGNLNSTYYRESVAMNSNRDGLTIIGQGRPIWSGANAYSTWTTDTAPEPDQYEFTSLAFDPPNSQYSSNCKTQRCGNESQLFIDGIEVSERRFRPGCESVSPPTLASTPAEQIPAHVADQADDLAPYQTLVTGKSNYRTDGEFYYDECNNKLRTSINPSGKGLIEITQRAFWLHASTGTEGSGMTQKGITDLITLRGIQFEKVATAAQRGGVRDFEGNAWIIENNIFMYANGASVEIEGDGAILRNNTILWSGQLGVAGAGECVSGCGVESPPPLTDTGLNQRVEYNRIYFSNREGYSAVWEGGGLKLVRVDNLLFLENEVGWNDGVGLWCDIDCSYNDDENGLATYGASVAFVRNRLHHNGQMGISYEISGDRTPTLTSASCLMDSNVAYENGHWRNGFQTAGPERDYYFGAGLISQNSTGCEIKNNKVLWNGDGITVMQQCRANPNSYCNTGSNNSNDSEVPRHTLFNNVVTGNLIAQKGYDQGSGGNQTGKMAWSHEGSIVAGELQCDEAVYGNLHAGNTVHYVSGTPNLAYDRCGTQSLANLNTAGHGLNGAANAEVVLNSSTSDASWNAIKAEARAVGVNQTPEY